MLVFAGLALGVEWDGALDVVDASALVARTSRLLGALRLLVEVLNTLLRGFQRVVQRLRSPRGIDAARQQIRWFNHLAYNSRSSVSGRGNEGRKERGRERKRREGRR